MDNRAKILIALPILLFIILVLAANYIHVEEHLSGAEAHILGYTPSDIKIMERKVVLAKSSFKSPFDYRSAAAEQKDVKESDLVPEIDYNDKSLSLIVISGERKMAIINGNPLKEGDIVDGMKIARIEPGRVLLKNKSSRWLYLEK